MVPHYLRTKPEPEVEERLQPVLNRASTLTTEAAQVFIGPCVPAFYMIAHILFFSAFNFQETMYDRKVTFVFQKQINAMNKMTSNIVDIIKSHQETMEKEASKSGLYYGQRGLRIYSESSWCETDRGLAQET